MSWEELDTKYVPCPCGKGCVRCTCYMDDWNRYKDAITIECSSCTKQYKLVHEKYYVGYGEYRESYCLLDINYPEYSGITVSTVFPNTVDIKELPFDEYLITTYTLNELIKARSELINTTAVARLSGLAAKIANQHKVAYHSAKIRCLRNDVINACKKYDSTEDNKDRRIPIELQEKKERAEYDKERKKHTFNLPF